MQFRIYKTDPDQAAPPLRGDLSRARDPQIHLSRQSRFRPDTKFTPRPSRTNNPHVYNVAFELDDNVTMEIEGSYEHFRYLIMAITNRLYIEKAADLVATKDQLRRQIEILENRILANEELDTLVERIDRYHKAYQSAAWARSPDQEARGSRTHGMARAAKACRRWVDELRDKYRRVMVKPLVGGMQAVPATMVFDESGNRLPDYDDNLYSFAETGVLVAIEPAYQPDTDNTV